MPFKKGQSGNPGGRPKGKPVYDAILMEMKAREKDKDLRGMRKLADVIWDQAEKGERWAAEFIRDTLDGKPAQAVTGEDGGPVEVVQTIRREIVRANPEDRDR